MSEVTKRALEQSLKNLLLKKPLNKITINDIAEDCGINRMTFYYHFKDIYDLVEWTFLTDNTQSLSGKRSYTTWQQGYLQIFDYVRENKNFVRHVYYSNGREILTRFLYEITYQLLLGVIDERADGIVVDEEDKAFIAHFYKYGFVGMVLEWIESGMKEEPKRLISHLDILTHGDIDKALGRFRTDRKLDIELRRG